MFVMNTANVKLIGQYTISAIVAAGIVVLMALKVISVAEGLPILTLAAGYKVGNTVGYKTGHAVGSRTGSTVVANNNAKENS